VFPSCRDQRTNLTAFIVTQPHQIEAPLAPILEIIQISLRKGCATPAGFACIIFDNKQDIFIIF
jgi:hypothetical protein